MLDFEMAKDKHERDVVLVGMPNFMLTSLGMTLLQREKRILEVELKKRELRLSPWDATQMPPNWQEQA